MAQPPKGPPPGASCADHKHYSVPLINDIYNYDVDSMFAFVFSDCPVQQTLSKQRHRSDVVWNPFQLEPDGFQRRELTYVVTLPHQKAFQFTEKQIIYPESKPGHLYLVDAECLSSNVPYGDSFSVVDRCYILQLEDNKCHLCITCEINFMKSLWGPVKKIRNKLRNAVFNIRYLPISQLFSKKQWSTDDFYQGLITDMTIENITKHFRALDELLKKQDPTCATHSDSDTSETPLEEPEAEVIPEGFEDSSFFYTGIIYLVFSCSIFCLACVIGVFFYGLWGSVDRMSFLSARQLNKNSKFCRRIPGSHPHVLTFADDLVEQLSELLASATKLIESTTQSLEELTEKEAKNEQRRQQLEQEEEKEGLMKAEKQVA